MLDVERAFREWVLAAPGVTALTDARVYAGRDVPPVGYALTDGACIALKTRGGAIGYDGAIYTASFQVKCYAETEVEAMALYRALYDALDCATGRAVLHAELEGPGTPLEEPETEWPFVLSYWSVMLREVW